MWGATFADEHSQHGYLEDSIGDGSQSKASRGGHALPIALDFEPHAA